MVLGRVVGSVVSTQKEKLLDGVKFLVVEKIDPASMKGAGEYVIAIDGVGAGEGEVVFYVSGSSARMTEVTTGRPADATITAIVESVDLAGKAVYQKKDDDGKSAPAGSGTP
jgi:ethanolamine utilization protein EutN/carbon dioxide concentrating mechanism protein CcmL